MSIQFVLIIMSFFSDRLKELRGDVSQTAFAARFGLKQAVYSHYETGRREPDLNTLCRISNILKVSSDYLLGLSDTESTAAIQKAGGGSVVTKKGKAS